MRHHPRTDANHIEIIKALRQAGCAVVSLASIGNGVPDLLVSRNGVNLLIEVKDGSKPPSARRLTEDEQEFHDKWKGPIATVNSIAEAIEAVNLLLV